MTAKQLESTLDHLAKTGFAQFSQQPVIDPSQVVSWLMAEYAEDAMRFGRLAVESTLRAKVNALAKKHSDVREETGDYEQVDLSDTYPDFPARTPARISVFGADGYCLYKRLDHTTRLEAQEHVQRQRRLMRGIQREVGEVDEFIEWTVAKKIPETMTPHDWREQMIAAGTVVAAAKRRG